MSLEVSYGTESGVAYIQLNNEKIATSRELEEAVVVDVDEYGCAVGVEILNLRAIPSADYVAKLVHVKEADMKALQVYLRQLMGLTFTNSSLTRRSRVQVESAEGELV